MQTDTSIDAASDTSSSCKTRMPDALTTNIYTSDPPASETKPSNGYTLHKTLAAYPSYGGYDVLYTGETTNWTFTIPAGAIKSAKLVLSIDGDDHLQPPATDYSFTVWADQCVYDKPAMVVHGMPAASAFNNWF